MECTKEVAIIVEEIAEKKTQVNDFLGAQQCIIVAQQLHPTLSDISQMLTACNVLCSASCMVLGPDLYWYGILQMKQTADKETIKKQFGKLALLLHPDKNTYPGAEAAFKLIRLACDLLTDPELMSGRSGMLMALEDTECHFNPIGSAYSDLVVDQLMRDIASGISVFCSNADFPTSLDRTDRIIELTTWLSKILNLGRGMLI